MYELCQDWSLTLSSLGLSVCLSQSQTSLFRAKESPLILERTLEILHLHIPTTRVSHYSIHLFLHINCPCCSSRCQNWGVKGGLSSPVSPQPDLKSQDLSSYTTLVHSQVSPYIYTHSSTFYINQVLLSWAGYKSY